LALDERWEKLNKNNHPMTRRGLSTGPYLEATQRKSAFTLVLVLLGITDFSMAGPVIHCSPRHRMLFYA